MIEYTVNHYDKLISALIEHFILVGITLIMSIPCAVLLSILVGKSRLFNQLTQGVLLIIYCIPSIALFALMIPIFGLGKENAIFGMVLYNLLLLLRNIASARKAISKEIKETALGMGLNTFQIITKVYFPIMLPYFISGLRVATVSTTGIATMAALINAGGLGRILFEGMRTTYMPKIIWGIILVAGLALIFNYIFLKLENRAIRFANGGNTIRV